MKRLLSVLMLLPAVTASADVLTLFEGQRIEGKVTEKGAHYEVETDLGTVTILKELVVKRTRDADAILTDAAAEQAKAKAALEGADALKDKPAELAEKLRPAIAALDKAIDYYSEIQENYTGLRFAHVTRTMAEAVALRRDLYAKMSKATEPKTANPADPAVTIEKPARAPLKLDLSRKELEELETKARGGDVAAMFHMAYRLEVGEHKPAESLLWYTPAGEREHAESQYRIGLMYLHGIANLAVDPKEARRWLVPASKNGFAPASAALAMLAFNGTGEPKSLKAAEVAVRKSIPKLRASALGADPEALAWMGWLTQHGVGVVTDAKAAVELYTKAALQGHPMACINLGSAYEIGEGVEPNAQEAGRWYVKAGEKGDPVGLMAAATAYRNGIGVSKDLKKGAEALQQAADQGFAKARFALAHAYLEGEGVRKRTKEAVTLLELAAKQGVIEAMHDLAVCYEKGRGVKRNEALAAQWFRSATEFGHIPSILHLAEGFLKDRDYRRAANYYREAAKRGIPEAQRFLGEYYERGRAGEKDNQAARLWYLSAAQMGDEESLAGFKRVLRRK